MLFFNLWAVPVIGVICVIALELQQYFPALMADRVSAYTIGALSIVVGAISEWFGFGGRIFFIPIWFWGIVIICVPFGPIGWAVAGILGVGGIFSIIQRGKKMEMQEWEKSQQEAARAPLPPIGRERSFWEWVNTRLYLPVATGVLPKHCEHNLRVLEAMKSAKPALANTETAAFMALESFLVANKTASKPVSLDFKLRTAVRKIIADKIKMTKNTAQSANIDSKLTTKAVEIGALNRFGNPLNDFENAMLAKRYGGMDIQQFIERLFNAELLVLVPEGQFQMVENKPVLIHNPRLFSIIEPQATSLAVFSHSSRATPVTKQYSEFRFAVTVQAGDFIMNLQPGTGLFINPYWDVNFQWTPQQLDDIKNMMKRGG